MINRLVTFGCSRTYGQGLADCKSEIGPGPEPSKLAWPSLLASKLDLKLVNMSRPGASNKEIWHTVMQSDLQDSDLVIVYWTHLSRTCISSDAGLQKDIQIGPWCDSKTSKAFYSYLYSDYDALVDFNCRSMFVDMFFKNLNINAVFVKQSYNRDIEQVRNDVCEWNTTRFFDRSLENYDKIYQKADDNLHPGPEAHHQFAEDLYRGIKNEFKI